ncbi:hypothetical protein ThrDRAFT_03181 [Frankia casuarinae]|uniref:Uncharacterized protein n=1 Tax=Frankia casuarinae (strain DSM 45818 / CECT 9043 / HFP020203 / CcI3) TaxID=106370 RepID=Q2J8A7_FRACC|nr:MULTISPECIES: hypothetical protein [Frankia]ABD12485.1 hypothetical protein Francci3_3128 [Frankia casuarinae]ETA00062.1 hypothetical protein CcI6DRAFT_04520 [Frankia sp. CcI6]EYT91162.1 hypothetical protein ThrDRAFT_03181 [Frankia casuarinae]KDA42335.1 hypothetical protein BMG523Draft_02852 [Frankia sp. BMG5.23]KEZ36375.1 hypothetical protein CEDDRAFT_02231 [Frankia sp. CeD]
MGTTVYNAAAIVAESVEHEDAPLTWWAAALVTFAAIFLLAVVLTLMTLWERKRHPHV